MLMFFLGGAESSVLLYTKLFITRLYKVINDVITACQRMVGQASIKNEPLVFSSQYDSNGYGCCKRWIEREFRPEYIWDRN